MYMAQERRQYILRLIEQRGSIRTAALARDLGVTDETIRTDLVELERRGLVQRVHGGARYTMPPTPGTEDSPRLDVQLAALAAAHIRPGTRLYVDSGPFARVLAARLQPIPCTFLTPSLRLLSALAPPAISHRVIALGNELDKGSGLLCHPSPVQLLSNLRPDIAILTPPALQPEQALYKHAVQACWAAAAARTANCCLLVVPSAALTATATHSAQLPAYRLITEDNVPGTFSHLPIETVPYISEDSFRDFDF